MITKEKALELWKLEMADKEYGYDFSGKKIKRDEYLADNRVGWLVAHVKPLETGGPDNDSNYVIMHHETFRERDGKYPTFEIVGKEYTVKYDKKNDFYYIEKILKDDDDGGFFI